MKLISVLPTAGNHFLMGGCREDGAVFSGVCSKRKRGNRHRLENRKSQLSIRKIYFHPRSHQTLEQIVQTGCAISIFGDIQNLTGQGVDYLL